ncbi:MAG: S-layer homology domain-containing protein, partial [Oscillospiraceae bacterium]|nr:S-layer homology domain-containing protein [Oscillospiraceae bacterium]
MSQSTIFIYKNYKLKLIFRLLAVILFSVWIAVTALSPRLAHAEGGFAGGDGTEAKPYLIDTPEQLSRIREYMAPEARFELNSDIVLPSNWAALGSETSPFEGIFNGSGHKIFISSPVNDNGDDVRVFNFTARDSTIKDIEIITFSAKVDYNVLVPEANAYGKIYNVKITNYPDEQKTENNEDNTNENTPDNTNIENDDSYNEYTLIYNFNDLDNIRNDLDGKFRLANDINLSGVNWTPIGDNLSKFNGEFDGDGYSINALCINAPESKYTGLFGYVGPNGKIKRLNLAVQEVTGGYNVGGLVGLLQGTVEDSRITSDNGVVIGASGAMYVGGMVGYVDENASVSRLDSKVSVKGGNGSVAGGLLGYIYKANGSELSVSGSVVIGADDVFVGGLVGFVNQSVIENSYASAEVTGGAKSRAGGLTGGISAGAEIRDSYSMSSVEAGTDSNAGGFAGQSRGSAVNVYAFGKVIAERGLAGGLVGNNIGTLSGAYSVSDSRYNGYGLAPIGSGDGGAIKLTVDELLWLDLGREWSKADGTSLPHLSRQGNYSKDDILMADVRFGGNIQKEYELSIVPSKITAFYNSEFNTINITLEDDDASEARNTILAPEYAGAGRYVMWVFQTGKNGIAVAYRANAAIVDQDKIVLVPESDMPFIDGRWYGDVRYSGADNVTLYFERDGVRESGYALTESGEYKNIAAIISDDFGKTIQRDLPDVIIDKMVNEYDEPSSGSDDTDDTAAVIDPAAAEIEFMIFAASENYTLTNIGAIIEAIAENPEIVNSLSANARVAYNEAKRDYDAAMNAISSLDKVADLAEPNLTAPKLSDAIGAYAVLGDNQKALVLREPGYSELIARCSAKLSEFNSVNEDGKVRRGEAMRMLYSLDNAPPVYAGENPFGDVAADNEWTDAILWGYSKNIVIGVGNGMFAPDDNLTREQAAKILCIYAGGSAIARADAADYGEVSGWAVSYVDWAVSNGVLTLNNGNIEPQGTVSFDELTVMLQ